MPEAPVFTVNTPKRCYGQRKDRRGAVCGELATWMLESPHGLERVFLCDACRRPGVVPIAPHAPFRRVTAMIEVLLSATSLVPGAAHREAVDRIAEAVQQAGGVFNLVTVTSTVGRFTPSPPSGYGKHRAPKGQ